MMIQLDLFSEIDELTEFKMTLQEFKESQDKLRKRFFAAQKEDSAFKLQMLQRLDLIEELLKNEQYN